MRLVFHMPSAGSCAHRKQPRPWPCATVPNITCLHARRCQRGHHPDQRLHQQHTRVALHERQWHLVGQPRRRPHRQRQQQRRAQRRAAGAQQPCLRCCYKGVQELCCSHRHLYGCMQDACTQRLYTCPQWDQRQMCWTGLCTPMVLTWPDPR